MTTTQQDLKNYQELFGEPGLDKTAGHTQAIFAAFTADATNTATSAELLAQASTTLDPLAFLLVWGNQVHVVHNVFEVRGSIMEPNARHVVLAFTFRRRLRLFSGPRRRTTPRIETA